MQHIYEEMLEKMLKCSLLILRRFLNILIVYKCVHFPAQWDREANSKRYSPYILLHYVKERFQSFMS